LDSWIGMIGTVLGIILGGGIALFGTYIQISHQRQLERKKRLLEKYEGIHELLGKIVDYISIWATNVFVNVAANINIDPEKLKSEVCLDHLQMLVDFYAPSLKPEVEAIGVIYKEVFILVTETFTEKNKTSAWKAKVGNLAASIPQKLVKHSDNAKSKLTALAGELTK